MRKSRPRPKSEAEEKKEKMLGLPLHTARMIRSVLMLFTRTEREDYGRGTALHWKDTYSSSAKRG